MSLADQKQAREGYKEQRKVNISIDLNTEANDDCLDMVLGTRAKVEHLWSKACYLLWSSCSRMSPIMFEVVPFLQPLSLGQEECKTSSFHKPMGAERKALGTKIERGRGTRRGVRRVLCSRTDSREGGVNSGGAYLMCVAVCCYSLLVITANTNILQYG